MLFTGKLLEFLGALLLAYTVVRASLFEWGIGKYLAGKQDLANADLAELRTQLREIVERRKTQFGGKEATATILGGVLFVVGSGIYLIALHIGH